MFHQPKHPLLQKRIACYWIIQVDGIPRDTKMLPDGYSDIMINLGTPYTVVPLHGEAQVIKKSVLFGQRTGSLLLRQSGSVNMIGIRLRPGTEYAFTGLDASSLVDKTLPLAALKNEVAATNLQRLETETLSEEKKIEIVEHMLVDMMSKNNKYDTVQIDKAVQLILNRRGNITVEELLEHMMLSYKQAERLFKKNVGLSPKLFARIHRFYYAFTQVRALQKADWMTVLHNSGYYDQAHFIKDFRRFSGLSPTRQFAAKHTLDEFFKFR